MVSWISLACVVILACQNASLETRLDAKASMHELSDLRMKLSNLRSEGLSRRRPLAVMTGADVLTHTASSGTNELVISSDQAVKVENTRFEGFTLGVAGDSDPMTLASQSLIVNGDLPTSR